MNRSDQHLPTILFHTTQVNGASWGGSEKFWFEIVTSKAFRLNFRSHVLMFSGPDVSPYVQELQKAGAQVDFTTPTRPGMFRRVYTRVKRTWGHARYEDSASNGWTKLLSRVEPTLVWFNLCSLNTMRKVQRAADACRHRKTPYWLIVQHAPEHFFLSTDEEVGRAQELLQGAARILCVSERNRQSLERAVATHLTNVTLARNALEERFFQRGATTVEENPVCSAGTARFLQLARFAPDHKGQHLLLATLADDRWRDRDWSLRLQGGGYTSNYASSLVRYYGLPSDRLSFGEADDVIPVIAESDLLLMPSLAEGTPFALVEAMACGRAAVTTPVGGMPELVHEGTTGWLARSTELSDFADALERAWKSRDRWKEVGENARRLVNAEYCQSATNASVVQWLTTDVTARPQVIAPLTPTTAAAALKATVAS